MTDLGEYTVAEDTPGFASYFIVAIGLIIVIWILINIDRSLTGLATAALQNEAKSDIHESRELAQIISDKKYGILFDEFNAKQRKALAQFIQLIRKKDISRAALLYSSTGLSGIPEGKIMEESLTELQQLISRASRLKDHSQMSALDIQKAVVTSKELDLNIENIHSKLVNDLKTLIISAIKVENEEPIIGPYLILRNLFKTFGKSLPQLIIRDEGLESEEHQTVVDLEDEGDQEILLKAKQGKKAKDEKDENDKASREAQEDIADGQELDVEETPTPTVEAVIEVTPSSSPTPSPSVMPTQKEEKKVKTPSKKNKITSKSEIITATPEVVTSPN